MNILYGLISKDSGSIKIRGEAVDFASPADAIRRGIGMVHQHFKLISNLTVTENVVLGIEPLLKDLTAHLGAWKPSLNPMIPINFRKAAAEIKRIGEDNGLEIDPKARVQDLPIGLRQRVEIIKILYRKADILILDEPTAVLTPQEVDDLFETLAAFRKSRKTIILITHKLREPMALCDRITVLRDGALVGTVNREDTSAARLAEMMVGRSVVFRVSKKPASPGKAALSVRDLQVKDDLGLLAVKGVSFDVHAREILGLAGVEGNGQLELVEAIWGIRKAVRGEIRIEDQKLKRLNPHRAMEAGVAYIPQDRQGRGLILGFSVKENLVLGAHDKSPYSRLGFLNAGAVTGYSARLVHDYSIRVSDLDAPMETLSGGNQQKAVVARALASRPRVVIASHPTRGLDVGATEHIHEVLIKMRDAGAAVFLVSADLEEIMHISDRIAVMYEGRIVATKLPKETNEREVGLLMAGHQGEVKVEEAA